MRHSATTAAETARLGGAELNRVGKAEPGVSHHESTPGTVSRGAGRGRDGTAESRDRRRRAVVLRPMSRADVPAVRALQLEAFPVRYNDKYYEGLFLPSRSALVACVAAGAAEDGDGGDGSSESKDDAAEKVRASPPRRRHWHVWSSHGMLNSLQVVGVVTARETVEGTIDSDDDGDVCDVCIDQLLCCGACAGSSGCCAACRRGDHGPDGYIMTIAVDPLWRGCGIGKKLLVACQEEMFKSHHVRRLRLDCLTDNHVAISMYRSHGFQLVRKMTNHYYINGEYRDAFRMAADHPSLARRSATAGRGSWCGALRRCCTRLGVGLGAVGPDRGYTKAPQAVA